MNVTVTLSEAEALAIAAHAEGDRAMAAQEKVLAAVERARAEAAEAEARASRLSAAAVARRGSREEFERRADEARLGRVQREVLRSLVTESYPGGWYWGTASQTLRTLESLVRKGMASKVESTSYGRPTVRYTATDAGREVVGGWTR